MSPIMISHQTNPSIYPFNPIVLGAYHMIQYIEMTTTVKPLQKI